MTAKFPNGRNVEPLPPRMDDPLRTRCARCGAEIPFNFRLCRVCADRYRAELTTQGSHYRPGETLKPTGAMPVGKGSPAVVRRGALDAR